MQKVLVQFEETTLKAIDRIAPVARRKRADFIRSAVKDAIFRHEQERMREAYRLQPDSAQEAYPWDLPEAWDLPKAPDQAPDLLKERKL
jgi:hypothetical protein